jgi:LPXTG-motif cell wall-anchored protein
MKARKSRLSILLVITLILSNMPWLSVAGEGIPHFADLLNDDFEQWTGNIPDNWNGSISNIPASGVARYSENPHAGSSSLQLINTSGTGQRFTSLGYQIYTGVQYTVSYWVRGKGDIRVRYHDGGYKDIGGTTYNSIDSQEWVKIEVSFTANTTYSNTQLILFIRNTDPSKNHLQVDDVQITYVGEIPDPEDPGPEKDYITSLENKSFELWTGGKPDAWVGPATNFAAARVLQYTDSSHTGSSAVQLINTGTSHNRFTSRAYSIEASTEYTATYWVRGKGDVRNAVYRGGGYSSYSAYTQVDSDQWQKITYKFQHTAAVDDVELIFSVRNTSDVRNHLQLDNVSVYKTAENVTTLLEARGLPLSSPVTVEGVVVGIFGNRQNIYFQDSTAGMVARLSASTWANALEVGDVIRISGTMNVFNNLIQVAVTTAEGFSILETSAGTPAPETVTLDQLDSSKQGQLVTVEDLTVVSVGTGTNYTVQVKDSLDRQLELRVENTVARDYFTVDKVLNVTAPVGQFGSAMQLMIRGSEDLKEGIVEERVAPVQASPGPGMVEVGTTVQLSTATPDATIFYTLDGSNPSVESPEYSGPIVVNASLVLKAYATAPGLADSIVSTFTYSIPAIMPIAQARCTPVGNTVLLEGIITAVHGSSEAYIQDDTAGIMLYSSNIASSVAVGDAVSLEGGIAEYAGEIQVNPTDITVISPANPMPAPVETSLKHLGQTTNVIDVSQALASYQGNEDTIVVRGVITSVNVNDEFGMQIADRLDPSKTLSVALPAGYRSEFSPYNNPEAVGKMVVVMGQEKNYFGLPAIRQVSIWDGTTSNPMPYYVNYDIEGQRVLTKYPFEVTGKDSYGFYGTDEEGDVYFYTGRAANLNLADIKVGDWYVVTGIVAYYNRPQVKIANGDDIEVAVPPGAQDPREPMVLEPRPAPFSSTYNRTPIISVRLEKSDLTVAEIDYSRIELFLNGASVSPDVDPEGNKVSYLVPSPLEFGEQEVRILVPDTEGRTKDFSWFFTVTEEESAYNFYFGVPHSHTSYSDGSGTPLQAFYHARGNGLQYHIVTDHSNWLDGVSDSNFEYDVATNQYVERDHPVSGSPSQWKQTRLDAELFNSSFGDFRAMRGFEMTSSIWGHMNTINSDTYVEAKSQMVPLREYYQWIVDVSTSPGADVFSMFNHPNWPDDSFSDLAYVEELDRYINGIEVGNGAPPYSYARAESHYWKALDNGWRLGAMNSQDNHAENWGEGDNLTVVIAPDLSEEAFIAAMNARRMYSTETRTLALTVKGNGYWMGSVLDVSPGDKVDFEVLAQDTEVPVEKLQLITNGGWVADEITYPGGTNSATWEPSVTAAGGAQWYVVKVIHTDDSWAHASPIFIASGENDLKLTALNVSPNPTLPGLETELAVTITNMGIRHVDQEVEVSFYFNDPSVAANLIGTVSTSERIPAGAAVELKTVWSPPDQDGQHRIYAVMTDIPDVTTVTTLSKGVDIVKPIGKKILFDGAHANSEVPGTTTEIIDMLRLYGYEAINHESGAITPGLLIDVDVLIINTPTSSSSYYTAAEETAIAQWVQSGGSILVANKSNFSHEPLMLNSLMEEVGSSIRFNDDNVYEPEGSDKYDGGMVWSVNSHNLPQTNSGLNDNMLAIRMFSSSSLVAVDSMGNFAPLVNNSATGLEILLGGNATSYNALAGPTAWVYNEEGQFNGEDIPMIAKEEVGSGKVVAAGRYFYSDYEIGNDVSNTALTLRVIDWLAGYQRVRSIRDVKDNANSGDMVTLRGVVTAPTNHFFDVLYIQDDTSGVAVYGTQAKDNLPLGTEVIVTGKVTDFEGELELAFDNYNYQVLFVGPVAQVEPMPISTQGAMSLGYTGMLVRTKGFITEFNQAESYFVLDDGSGPAHIHVDGYVGADMSRFVLGDYVQATGIASLGSVGPRIRVRFHDDLVALEAPDPGEDPEDPGDREDPGPGDPGGPGKPDDGKMPTTGTYVDMYILLGAVLVSSGGLLLAKKRKTS